MTTDSSSNEPTNNDSDLNWERTFDMFKLEYVQATQRYENIYKAIWQIFQYMALLAAGILTFGSRASNFPSEIIVFIALSPLVFWFFATYLPMDQYGQNILRHLKSIENQINKKCKNFCSWKIEHYLKSGKPKPWWRVRRAVIIFGVIVSVAWIFSGTSIYTNHRLNDLLFWEFIIIVSIASLIVTAIDMKLQQKQMDEHESREQATKASTTQPPT